MLTPLSQLCEESQTDTVAAQVPTQPFLESSITTTVLVEGTQSSSRGTLNELSFLNLSPDNDSSSGLSI